MQKTKHSFNPFPWLYPHPWTSVLFNLHYSPSSGCYLSLFNKVLLLWLLSHLPHNSTALIESDDWLCGLVVQLQLLRDGGFIVVRPATGLTTFQQPLYHSVFLGVNVQYQIWGPNLPVKDTISLGKPILPNYKARYFTKAFQVKQVNTAPLGLELATITLQICDQYQTVVPIRP